MEPQMTPAQVLGAALPMWTPRPVATNGVTSPDGKHTAALLPAPNGQWEGVLYLRSPQPCYAPSPVAAIACAVAEARAHIKAMLALLPPEPIQWQFFPDAPNPWWSLKKGIFEFMVVEHEPDFTFGYAVGWWVGMDGVDESPFFGPETGAEGKTAAYAAYLRACGGAE